MSEELGGTGQVPSRREASEQELAAERTGERGADDEAQEGVEAQEGDELQAPRSGWRWAYVQEALAPRTLRMKRQALVFLVLVMASSYVFESSPANGIILCPFRLFTGIECAGCGMTRSWCALVDGDWDGAIAFNPFGPVLFGLAIFKSVFLSFEVFSRRRLHLPPWEKVRTVVLGSVAGAMMVFGLYRIYAFFALG